MTLSDCEALLTQWCYSPVAHTFFAVALREEEKKAVMDDPKKLLEWRRSLESSMNVSPLTFREHTARSTDHSLYVYQSNHTLTILDSEIQKVFRPLVEEHMHKALEKKPWIAEKRTLIYLHLQVAEYASDFLKSQNAVWT